MRIYNELSFNEYTTYNLNSCNKCFKISWLRMKAQMSMRRYKNGEQVWSHDTL